MSEEEMVYAIRSYAAFKQWRREGWPITKAAREYSVEPDDIMLTFKREHRMEFRFFMAKLTLALWIAGFLVATHDVLKSVSSALDRRL